MSLSQSWVRTVCFSPSSFPAGPGLPQRAARRAAIPVPERPLPKQRGTARSPVLGGGAAGRTPPGRTRGRGSDRLGGHRPGTTR